jgi:transposase
VLGAQPAQVLRAGATQKDADRDRGGAEDRRAVRDQARYQRCVAGRAKATRQTRSKLLVESFETWLRAERKKLSPKGPLAKAIDYQLNHWAAFTRFLDDGRICLSNNAAERAIRGIAVGRRNWTFCGSDSGGHRAAVMYTLIESAKLSEVDPKAWLANVLARIADHPARQIEALLPWNWKAALVREAARQAG